MIELLESDLTATEKKDKIVALTWDYNKNSTPAELKNKNIEAVEKVFALISAKQKKKLVKKVKSYAGWVEAFVKEDYSH